MNEVAVVSFHSSLHSRSLRVSGHTYWPHLPNLA